VFGVSGWEIVVLGVLALVVFGPDRLPGVMSDAARMLRQLRRMAQDARSEMADVMPELDELRDLDPRSFVRRQLLEEADDLRDTVEDDPARRNGDARRAAPGPNGAGPNGAGPSTPAAAHGAPNGSAQPTPAAEPASDASGAATDAPAPWDADAT
jgi:sec-independent protein translocase protein TatB